jgi:hypothetical protein
MLWLGAMAIVAGADYLAWLGWHRHKHLNAAGDLTGPYETWQVLGVIAVLVGAVFFATRRRRPIATVSVPIVVTALFTIQAVSDEPNDGLWGVGALFLLAVASIGTWLVVLASQRWPRRVGER